MIRGVIGAVAVVIAVMPAPGGAAGSPYDFPGTAAARVGQMAAAGAPVRIAVAEDAPPFSWIGIDGHPIGYAVEVCRRVAVDLARDAGREPTGSAVGSGREAGASEPSWVPVADEAGAVARGEADLGCSAVADAGVAGPTIAVSGTRLLVARLGDVSSVRDLGGRTVAVVAGTRSAATLARVAAAMVPAPRLRIVPGPGDGYGLLASGAVDALAGDDLLLAGLLATRTDGPSFEIVGRPLDRGMLGIAIRPNDPALAQALRRSVARMVADGTLTRGYDRWFTTPVPGGASADRPRGREWEAVVAGPR